MVDLARPTGPRLQKRLNFVPCLTAERLWIAQVAFIELDIFLSQIARVEHAIVPAGIQEDMKIEFRLADDGAQGLQRDASRLAAAHGKRDLSFSRPAVTDIHLRLVH